MIGDVGEKAGFYDEYAPCDICSGRIDLTRAGYYKSVDSGTFHHAICHENGRPPEGYVAEFTDTRKPCVDLQFNCGHTINAPRSAKPMVCPECNGLRYKEGEWSVSPNTGQRGYSQ